MTLDKMNCFCEGQLCTASAAPTNILDWGSDGVDASEVTGLPNAKYGAGSHGDDITHQLYLCVHAAGATAASALNVSWETSDDPEFADESTAVLKTWAFTAGGWPNLHYPIAGEPLPRGLKRFQRLKIDGGSVDPKATITAFVTDSREDPVDGKKM